MAVAAMEHLQLLVVQRKVVELILEVAEVELLDLVAHQHTQALDQLLLQAPADLVL